MKHSLLPNSIFNKKYVLQGEEPIVFREFSLLKIGIGALLEDAENLEGEEPTVAQEMQAYLDVMRSYASSLVYFLNSLPGSSFEGTYMSGMPIPDVREKMHRLEVALYDSTLKSFRVLPKKK